MRFLVPVLLVLSILLVAGCAPPDLQEDYPLEPVRHAKIGVVTPETGDSSDDAGEVEPNHNEPVAEPMEPELPDEPEPAEPFKEAPAELEEVEISEYNGVKLGSADDFRENSILGPQYIDKDEYRLEISGLVEDPVYLTYEQVLHRDMFSKIVTLNCVEGWSVRILWEGVLMKHLLGEVNIDPEANTVILHAYDGYTTSLPLDYFLDNNIMLAYKMNNVTLPPERGFPFQLVAEQKWGYKWIKWVTKIELSDDPEYRGFWESRNWDQEANLNESPRAY